MAAPTRVQTTGWQRTTSDSQTFTITISPTAGSLLLLSVADLLPGRKMLTPTDTRGNTWLSAVEVQNTTISAWHQIFYVRAAIGGGTTISATVEAGSGDAWLIATEVTGHNATEPVSVVAFNGESGVTSPHTASSSGVISLGTDVYVYVSGHLLAYANTLTEGSGYTKIDDEDINPPGGYWQLLAEDKTTSGAYSSDGPWASDVARTGTSAMLSIVGGGSSGSPTTDGKIVFQAR